MIKQIAAYLGGIALTSLIIFYSFKKEDKTILTVSPEILSYIVIPKKQDLISIGNKKMILIILILNN